MATRFAAATTSPRARVLSWGIVCFVAGILITQLGTTSHGTPELMNRAVAMASTGEGAQLDGHLRGRAGEEDSAASSTAIVQVSHELGCYARTRKQWEAGRNKTYATVVEAALAQRDECSNTVVLTETNSGFIELARNWLLHVQRMQTRMPYFVAALDPVRTCR
jgi:hypothetical protein